ncbi:hypothetical protein [Desulfopila sp. IMCC35008]|uniref:hypothetical protein n=1 Tax=Desulfopila sp. IMCC35008 TaxID=2653858 RepID=UPI0013D5D58A|nr:hypothetical protein [Desulfopila sp. IMCC35008]
MEVKEQDARIAVEILQRDYQETTALAHHDLSTAQAIFDEQAGEVQCPACGTSFTPTTATCPECGLSFG